MNEKLKYKDKHPLTVEVNGKKILLPVAYFSEDLLDSNTYVLVKESPSKSIAGFIGVNVSNIIPLMVLGESPDDDVLIHYVNRCSKQSTND